MAHLEQVRDRRRRASTASRGARSRPKSLTIDIHSHVGVPRAAEFVKPHLDVATIPLAHFATRRDQGAQRRSRRPTSARACAALDAALRRSRRHGRRHAADHAAAAAVLLHRAARHRGAGGADDQRRHRRVRRQASPTASSRSARVPMQDGNEAAKELERCMTKLGFKGVEILTNVGGKELSDPAFAPFWKKAEELGALVVIHPNGFTEAERLSRFYFNNVIGNPLETTHRAALPDLRRRAGAPPQPEDPRRARRRLSRRLFRPHRPRLGRALGLPRPPAASRRPATSRRSTSTPWCSRRTSSQALVRPSAPTTSSWAPTIPSTWPTSIRSSTSFGRRLR